MRLVLCLPGLDASRFAGLRKYCALHKIDAKRPKKVSLRI